VGLFSGSTKTFSSIATFTLLEKNIYDKQSRKSSLYSSNGDMGLYIQTYTSQRRNYRKHYSKKKLDRLGFSPSSDGVAKVLNTTLALDFIVSSDNTATTIRLVPPKL